MMKLQINKQDRKIKDAKVASMVMQFVQEFNNNSKNKYINLSVPGGGASLNFLKLNNVSEIK